MKKKDELRRKTCTVLTEIVLRIQDLLPEIQMEEAGKRFTMHANRMDRDKATTPSSQVEECQRMLDTLDMNGPDQDMCKMMKKLDVVDKKKMENEDISFWEELEILNEEDFSSPEEEESLAAEKILMDRFEEYMRYKPTSK